MSARLTLNVSGKVRWINVKPGALINNAITRVVEEANRLNVEIVPKGKTGELQSSFRSEQTERSVRFYWDAPYAMFVDEGTGESTGRYVPAIGKRLVNKEMSPRRQVFRAAQYRGYTAIEARAALTTPIKELPGKSILLAKSRTPGYPNIEAYGVYDTKTRSIEIAMGGPHKEATLRHELAHAVQHKAREQESAVFGKSIESRAEYLAKVAAQQRKDIGTHPGIKAHHFRQKMINALKPLALQFTLDEIKRGFHT